MPLADLDMLSNEGLVDLGAQLESDFAAAKIRYSDLVAKLEADNTPLLKPGVKLAVNATLGIAGVSLAPITWNWSLVLTIIGSVVTISDAVDFSGDTSRVRSSRREMVRLRREMREIVIELEDVNELITRRVG